MCELVFYVTSSPRSIHHAKPNLETFCARTSFVEIVNKGEPSVSYYLCFPVILIRIRPNKVCLEHMKKFSWRGSSKPVVTNLNHIYQSGVRKYLICCLDNGTFVATVKTVATTKLISCAFFSTVVLKARSARWPTGTTAGAHVLSDSYVALSIQGIELLLPFIRTFWSWCLVLETFQLSFDHIQFPLQFRVLVFQGFDDLSHLSMLCSPFCAITNRCYFVSFSPFFGLTAALGSKRVAWRCFGAIDSY